MANENSHAGLTVVITGASSGFGKGVAQKLGAEGANVVLAARRTELIEELAIEIGPNALAVTTDVSQEEDVKHLFESAIAAFGSIDVWINNAAVGVIGPFTEVPTKDITRAVQINVIGTIYGSHYALRHFKEQKTGTLINVGSVSGKIPYPYYTPYSMTKFAVTGLSAALHQEIELEGWDKIHVCTVHPWATDTPWFEHTGNYTGHAAELKPMDDPEIVIDAIIDLISNPKESVDTGAKAKSASISSHLAPGATETFNAKYVKKIIQSAPPAPPTSGSLHEPMQRGTGVSGGIRERMKQEEKQQKRT
ncbi:SDR family oxidoreductase [Planomicrobium sp. CPCC 101110]|uniref:SDR family NAD(P)-dependent oxidoreductase n=1 Tax=Planomicrobium sp. CPCC 101110 TaxID=2599619 RepID=UPI0011B4A618|nr:SDR family NAD(P)-dependent oxidoreductase [Planomicrobium sp. CPCC 101110]TWT27342.1 SDR family NAD(P)-dependent oxidoreductase [Planomicrobium sp. CPCC 101110]